MVACFSIGETLYGAHGGDRSLTCCCQRSEECSSWSAILDQAVVDIETGEGLMARLNGYVHQLQAVDKRQDTDFVSVSIRFVDEGPKKMEELSRFIARFRAGKR